ncbi:MAG: MFS transporter [Bryobacterales bacterium]|nr:MFS transporter [Bryobacterales bacterium]
MVASRSLWRNPDFLKLWTGQTISEIGSRITRDGLPFAAVTLLGATPTQMGVLIALGGIASLIAGPLAGMLADRYRRLPLLIWSDVGRAVILAIVPLAALQGWLSLHVLYIVVAAAGLLTIVFDVAYQSLLPSLVPKEQLLEGNAKLALTASTAEMIGPALAGMLIQLLTAPVAILADSLSFLASAASIIAIRTREDVRPTPHDDSDWRDSLAGMPYVFRHDVLRPLALRAATASFFFGFFSTLYTLFAVRELGISAAALGIVIAIGGGSNFLGAMLAEHTHRWMPLGRTLTLTACLPGMIMMLIPLARGPVSGVIVLGLAQLLGDIAYPIYHIHELTLRQKIAPPELLGRVNACVQMLFKGIWPIGALVGGLLASNIGPRATLFLAGLGVAASTLWLVFSRVRSLTVDQV